ncbi:hypothetical protein TspCOW1_21490 [Thiohalobacter sp. COW1]|uniref:RT0821/Lpp0805 family surface protein n=1 Tax=Thiohalobacter sp. COW1 TaxID=2795687 RepID=UPI001915A064|nr:glycine zipper domain-containing protein [Thiohalobacter sp. COW1]BCO32046.1 hypothetical protein TspCOW1_21490 [Thiohalobacter sp. COW1]
MNKLTLTLTAALVLTTGCATQPNNAQIGSVVGGALGGALGAEAVDGDGETAAIIAGTLVGAAIGGAVGQRMDEVDRMRAQQALETRRDGRSAAWRNPNTDTRYRMTPTETYQTSSGPCREYVLDAKIGGRTEQVHGVACRQADGSWKAQS